MAGTRRVILKPAGATQAQLTQLAQALAAAVELQQQLAARSPHVLRFTGTLQQNDLAFFVDHEPAEPLPIERFFDPQAPPIDNAALLRMAAAILDALRVAHGMKDARPAIHGGLCPGVILVGKDGIERITDFGFAPAVCAALGPDSYINLAAHPGAESLRQQVAAVLHDASGYWEVLPPDVSDRDDRLCAFIDPEKYGTRLYKSFEPSADIIAAGLLLHLLAERRHPYFFDFPEAHRLVEVAEGLGELVSTRGFRKELRESPDKAIQVWCDVVGRMNDRDPPNRPSAAQAAESLAGVGIGPASIDDILKSEIKAVSGLLEHAPLEDVPWDEIRRRVQPIARNPDASRAVVQLANAFLVFESAVKTLASEDWEQAAGPLAQVRAVPDLPSAAAQKAQQLKARLDQNLAVRGELAEIETALGSAHREQVAQYLNTLRAFQSRLEGMPRTPPLLPPVEQQLARLRDELSRQEKTTKATVDTVEAAARAWLSQAENALAAEDWELLEKHLSQRPELPSWVPDIVSTAGTVEARLAQHRAETEARRRYAQELTEHLRQAVDALAREAFAEARQLIQPVERQDMHAELAQQARDLHAKIDQTEKRFKEQQEVIRQARAHIDGLLQSADKAIKSGEWPSLENAESLLDDALKTEHISDAQRRLASVLLDEIPRRKQELLAAAVKGQESRAEIEEHLRRAREHLEREQWLEAEKIARGLARSEYPDIAAEAERIAADVAAVRGKLLQSLTQQLARAVDVMKQGQFADGLNLAREVEQNPYTDAALRAKALQIIEKGGAAQKSADQARQRAVADYDQALAAMRAGDLAAAQRAAESVLKNRQAEPAVLAGATQIVEDLAAVDAGRALIDREEFPGAMRAFDEILHKIPDPSRPAVQAATLLRQKAQKLLTDVRIKSIQRHLELRTRREEKVAEVDVFPPEESLPRNAPDWVRTTVHNFETFLHDCTLTARPARPDETLAAGSRLGDKYEIVEFLGRGGMGEVYRARDLKLKREVALKLAPAAAESRSLADALQNVAEAVAALNHPHIIHINSFDVIDERPCFDTNYIRGRDLAEYARQHPLTPRAIAEILIPVADALAYAHKQGVLHRDIKPQNIYLGERPGEGPWLIDFGLARMRSICDRRANTGLCGTPGYIAPEVVASLGEFVDHRADIFALGCVLYGLLAKQPPFQTSDTSTRVRPSISRTLLNTLRSQVKPLAQAAPQTPGALRAVCEKAMAAEPQDRYQNAAEIVEQLRQFLRGADFQDAQAELARAQARFDSRRQYEPAELLDLQEAARIAESSAGRGFDAVSKGANQLLAQIHTLLKQIGDSQQEVRGALASAHEALTAGRLKPALALAGEVLSNPYVPELHGDAGSIAESARQGLHTARKKLVRIGGLSTLTIGCVAAVAFWLTRPATPLAPSIVDQPAEVVVTAGARASFTVKARGRPEPIFQWEKMVDNQWQAMKGRTGSTLTLLTVIPADERQYRCVVTNASGSASSHPAALRIVVPPAIAKHPQGITVDENAAAELRVEVTGTKPLNFQWQKKASNGWNAVAGQQSEVLNLASAKEVDAGDYRCVITNAAGSAGSEPATLQVKTAPPPIVARPKVKSITADRTGPTNVETVGFTVEFDKEVSGFGEAGVTVKHDGTLSKKKISVESKSGSIYTVTISGLDGDGTLTLAVNVDAAKAADGQGNEAFGPSEPVRIDRVAPTVSLKLAEGQKSQTNAMPIRLTATFSEPVSGFDGKRVTITGTATGDKTVAVTGGPAVYEVVAAGPTGSGSIVAVIAANVATDAAGNGNTASPADGITVAYDVTAPGVTLARVAGQANPTNSSSIKFAAKFTEPVTGFDESDVKITGTASGTKKVEVADSGDHQNYTITVSGLTKSGTVIAAIHSKAAVNAAGNGNTASAGADNVVTYDATPPTVLIGEPSVALTRKGPVRFDLTFSEPVKGMGTDAVEVVASEKARAGKVSVTGTGGAVAVDGIDGTGPYTVMLDEITGDGALAIRLKPGTCADAAGNGVAADAPVSAKVTVDNTPPTLTIGPPSPHSTATGPVTYTITYTGADKITLADKDAKLTTLTGTATGKLAISGVGNASRTLTVAGIAGDGTLAIAIAAGTASDRAGNVAAAAESGAVDGTAFTVSNKPRWPEYAKNEKWRSDVAGALVNGQGNTWLRDYDAAAVDLRLDNSKLLLSIRRPGPQGRELLSIPVPDPQTALPDAPPKGLARTVELIAAEVNNQVNTAKVPEFYRWWGERKQLDDQLAKALSLKAPGDLKELKFDVSNPGELKRVSDYLVLLGRIKWMSEVLPADDLKSLTATLQKNLDDRTRKWVQPNRFIEYFWGTDHVYAFYWFVDDGDSWTVALRSLGGAAEFLDGVAFDPAKALPVLGARLLQPIVTARGGAKPFFASRGGGVASFGVAIAPDGPLCFVPMTELPFAGVPVQMRLADPVNLGQPKDVPAAGPVQVTRLAQLCERSFDRSPTAVWTFVSLTQPPQGTPGAPTDKTWGGLWRDMMNQGKPIQFKSADRDSYRYATAVSVGGNIEDAWTLISKTESRLGTSISSNLLPPDAGFLYPRSRPEAGAQLVVVSHLAE